MLSKLEPQQHFRVHNLDNISILVNTCSLSSYSRNKVSSVQFGTQKRKGRLS